MWWSSQTSRERTPRGSPAETGETSFYESLPHTSKPGYRISGPETGDFGSMKISVQRVDRSLLSIPIAAVGLTATVIATIWLLAGVPVVAAPLGALELLYGWRLKSQIVSRGTLPTVGWCLVVIGAVALLLGIALAVAHPIGEFSHSGTDTQTTQLPAP